MCKTKEGSAKVTDHTSICGCLLSTNKATGQDKNYVQGLILCLHCNVNTAHTGLSVENTVDTALHSDLPLKLAFYSIFGQ